MAPSPPPPFFYNWAKLFAILPWGGANFFYPCLYCLLCLVLGSLHVLLNATITSGLVELFGSVVKSAAESFLLIAYIAFASRQAALTTHVQSNPLKWKHAFVLRTV